MNAHTPLLTDLYQLTMAAGYWKFGKAEQEADFHLFFRKLPSAGIGAGLGDVVAWLKGFRFGQEELAYLATLPGRDGKALSESGFLDYLGKMDTNCAIGGSLVALIRS